jgi:hypothetical protein
MKIEIYWSAYDDRGVKLWDHVGSGGSNYRYLPSIRAFRLGPVVIRWCKGPQWTDRVRHYADKVIAGYDKKHWKRSGMYIVPPRREQHAIVKLADELRKSDPQWRQWLPVGSRHRDE